MHFVINPQYVVLRECVDENGIDNLSVLIFESQHHVVDFTHPTSSKVHMSNYLSPNFGLSWSGKPSVSAINFGKDTSLPFQLVVDQSKSRCSRQSNKIIEGDNLIAMQLLIPTYGGKVKLIYVDPPYNTGSKFVYKDVMRGTQRSHPSHDDDIGSHLSDSDFLHSAWLNFMYPRLLVARQFLTDDGLVVVSIDDHSFPQLRLVMDEIFGPQNHVATCVWQRKTAPNNSCKNFSTMHEYVLFYAKSPQFQLHSLPRTPDFDAAYRYDDHDGRGKWRPEGLTSSRAAGYGYGILSPAGKMHFPPAGRSWRMPRTTFERWLEEKRIYWGKNGLAAPARKSYLCEVKSSRTLETVWHHSDVGSTGEGTKELRKLFGTTSIFSYPKPVRLIQRIIELTTRGDDIILDIFAGSGTTADACAKQNQIDNSKRNWILIQSPEKFAAESEPAELGYHTIADVTHHRINLTTKNGYTYYHVIGLN